MGGVTGKRSSDGAGPGPASHEVHATPGKATRVGELERSAMYAAPAAGDVSDEARAEVGRAFGSRAQGVDYGVAGGAAEARGANAVTVAGKVDFAPGKLDLASHEGRARLGEETAHAVQQRNQGEPSSVRALEGEAKQAGVDFAAGRSPRVELAAPSGLALADDPKDPKAVPKDTDLSTEVPDLQNGEVDAIKKAIAAGDKDEALRLMLKALQRIDPTTFKDDDLSENKLRTGTSKTRQGPKFEAWLKTYLDDVAAKKSKATSKLTKGEVAKAMSEAKPPADQKDIWVMIGNGHFGTVSLLYSTVRHEFVHVQQLRKDYLTQISRFVMPAGLDPPDSGKLGEDREVEAYLWEMEHLANTGLTDPGELKLLWNACSNAFLNASAGATKTFGARFKAAFKDVWKKAMDGHIAAIGEHYQKFTASKTVAEPSQVEKLRDDMETLWLNRDKFENTWTAHTASHKTALDQATEMLTWIKSDRFTKLLDQIDGEIKTGYTNPDDPMMRRTNLRSAWDELEAATKTALKARYETTGPALWEKTFDAIEVEVRKRIKADDLDVAQELMDVGMKELFATADKGVKKQPFQTRREALQAEIKAARKAKKP